MANPTAAAIALIQAEIGDWTPSDSQIAATLNTATIANPAGQGTVPRVMSESGLAALLTDPMNGSLAKLLQYVNFALVKEDIDANNLAGVQLWAGKLELLGIVTSAEAAAIVGYTEPVPDPSWTAQISWAQANLGRAIDAGDIEAARPH